MDDEDRPLSLGFVQNSTIVRIGGSRELNQTVRLLSSMQTLRRTYPRRSSCSCLSFRCQLQSRQDENINKIILKNEDVVILATRGNRDRYRLILYPDVIVCCNLKTKLLAR